MKKKKWTPRAFIEIHRELKKWAFAKGVYTTYVRGPGYRVCLHRISRLSRANGPYGDTVMVQNEQGEKKNNIVVCCAASVGNNILLLLFYVRRCDVYNNVVAGLRRVRVTRQCPFNRTHSCADGGCWINNNSTCMVKNNFPFFFLSTTAEHGVKGRTIRVTVGETTRKRGKSSADSKFERGKVKI